ncbi:O-antigen ligase family protein [Vibrio sp. SCSIO 43132]|uniref:O-antigen ligase family protein n=1 Tax=Vibrio sp. SCSIO 43132 TaxID=2779363 RepID=UPI001CA97413|nr:O-antigen ligase family protein [Vibrio sp. SCSIO 43132]UAB71306.1 O-antigen ligase family protein [Vibrio sp. SCSIO 43132]
MIKNIFSRYSNRPASHVFFILFPIVTAIATNTHWGSFYYSHDVPKWLIIDIFVSAFIFFNREKVKILPSYINTLFLLAIYWIATSLFWAEHIYAGVEFLLRFVLFGIAFSLLVKSYSQKQRIQLLLLTSILSACLFVIVFIAERWLDVPYDNGAFTPIGFTNNAGHIFNIWIPALIFFLLRNSKNPILILISALALVGVLYVLNVSHIRTTIIALGMGSVIFVLLSIWKRFRTHAYKNKRVGRVGYVIILLGLVSLMDNSILPKSVSQSVAAIEAPLESYQPRLNMLRNSWDMLLDNPFGVGSNNFEFVHPEYAKAGTELGSDYVNERQILKTPHNFLAKVFTELGWIGGTLFMAIYLWVSWKALVLAWNQPHHDWVFISVFAVLTHSLLSQVFLSPMSYLFSILLFASLMKTEPVSETTQNVNHSRKWVLLILSIPVLSVTSVTSHFYHYQGMLQRDVEKLEKSVAIYPGNEVAWLDLARMNFRDFQDLNSALWASEKFLSLNPHHIYGRYFYSQLLIYNRQCSQAVKTLSGLLNHYPSYTDANALMSKALECRAREQAKRSVIH